MTEERSGGTTTYHRLIPIKSFSPKCEISTNKRVKQVQLGERSVSRLVGHIRGNSMIGSSHISVGRLRAPKYIVPDTRSQTGTRALLVPKSCESYDLLQP